jgi:hypothetical protein
MARLWTKSAKSPTPNDPFAIAVAATSMTSPVPMVTTEPCTEARTPANAPSRTAARLRTSLIRRTCSTSRSAAPVSFTASTPTKTSRSRPETSPAAARFRSRRRLTCPPARNASTPTATVGSTATRVTRTSTASMTASAPVAATSEEVTSCRPRLPRVSGNSATSSRNRDSTSPAGHGSGTAPGAMSSRLITAERSCVVTRNRNTVSTAIQAAAMAACTARITT